MKNLALINVSYNIIRLARFVKLLYYGATWENSRGVTISVVTTFLKNFVCWIHFWDKLFLPCMTTMLRFSSFDWKIMLGCFQVFNSAICMCQLFIVFFYFLHFIAISDKSLEAKPSLNYKQLGIQRPQFQQTRCGYGHQ